MTTADDCSGPEPGEEELMQAYARLAKVAAERDGWRAIALVLVNLMTREQFAEFRHRIAELDDQGGAPGGIPS